MVAMLGQMLRNDQVGGHARFGQNRCLVPDGLVGCGIKQVIALLSAPRERRRGQCK
jgi:hypothetical protein